MRGDQARRVWKRPEETRKEKTLADLQKPKEQKRPDNTKRGVRPQYTVPKINQTSNHKIEETIIETKRDQKGKST